MPKVVHMGVLSPKVVHLQIQEGEMIPGYQVKYVKQQGDSVAVVKSKLRDLEVSYPLFRNGKEIGWLSGPHHEILAMGQQMKGQDLKTENITQASAYKVFSKEDDRCLEGVSPLAVYQKSKANNWVEPSRKFMMLHDLYFELPFGMKPNARYTLEAKGLNVDPQKLAWDYNEQVENFAFQLPDIGYQLDDPSKTAYLSAWLGTGGSFSFDDARDFEVRRANDNKVVFKGKVEKALDENEVEYNIDDHNFAKTNVYQLKFGELANTGEYYIEIPSFGRSEHFKISKSTFSDAFKVAMKGFFHIRGNMEMKEPYTDFKRPEAYLPNKDIKTYRSAVSLMNTGNGLNARGLDKDNFGELLKHKTDELVTINAYGGYHDAGDWDRRVQHLYCSRLMLELFELYPAYFEAFNGNIPESKNNIPDIIDEVIFNISFYKSLQTAEGGICGGLEAEDHPREGETSYQESYETFVYAPDMWSSFIYAGVASRLSYLVEQYDAKLAAEYKSSALKAYQWGEGRFSAAYAAKSDQPLKREVFTEKSQAALDLYRLTGNRKFFHDFKQFSALNPSLEKMAKGNANEKWPFFKDAEAYQQASSDALFLLQMVPQKLLKSVDYPLVKQAEDMLIAQADSVLHYQQGNAYNIGAEGKSRSIMVGYFSVAHGMEMARAYRLTHQQKYLQGIFRSTDYALGANPMRLVYMSGLTDKSIKNSYHPDSRLTGQKLPAGILCYGQFDPEAKLSAYFTWPLKYYLNEQDTPAAKDFPAYEFYHDIYRWMIQNEWTPQQTMAPNAYVWGFLAAQASQQQPI